MSPIDPITLICLAAFVYWILQNFLHKRHERQMAEVRLRMAEVRLRQLEQLRDFDEATQQRLLATMPEWLDPEDAADVEAWKQARAETLRVGKQKGG